MQLKSWFNPRAATPQGIDWTTGRGVIAQFFFPTDKSNLDPQDLDVVTQLASHLKVSLQTDRVELAIIGHADYRASDEYNKNLGMRRAKSVASALNRLLRTEPHFSLFSAQAAGERYARQGTRDEQTLARDRRVDEWSTTIDADIPTRLPPIERKPQLQRLVHRSYESLETENWVKDQGKEDFGRAALKGATKLLLKKILGQDDPVPGAEDISDRQYAYMDATFRVNIIDIRISHYVHQQGGGKVEQYYTDVYYTWGRPNPVIILNKTSRHHLNDKLKQEVVAKGKTVDRKIADKDSFFFPPPFFSEPE